MVERIIAGMQTGADIAGIKAARQVHWATGGWMPKGFLTEAGPMPEYEWKYGAWEHASADYPPRTRSNVAESDATLLFVSTRAKNERGCDLTRACCAQLKKPMVEIHVGPVQVMSTAKLAKSIQEKGFRVINVAGTRGSADPPPTTGPWDGVWMGVEAWVFAYLLDTFTIIAGSSP